MKEHAGVVHVSRRCPVIQPETAVVRGIDQFPRMLTQDEPAHRRVLHEVLARRPAQPREIVNVQYRLSLVLHAALDPAD